MFHINEKKLKLEERENGVADLHYFEGVCMTCEHSPDRECRAACPKADFFGITGYISRMAGAKTTKHICRNWVLCSEITSCFKKTQAAELQNIQKFPSNGQNDKKIAKFRK